MINPFLGISSGFFCPFFLLSSALVGSVPNTIKRLSAVKEGAANALVQPRIPQRWHQDHRAVALEADTRRAPLCCARKAPLCNLSVTILRHICVGDELSVAGNLGRLNRSPVVVFLSERAFCVAGLGCCTSADAGPLVKRNRDCCQQTDCTNQRCSQTERGSSGRRYSEAHGDHLTKLSECLFEDENLSLSLSD
jgi:hypothetical protein